MCLMPKENGKYIERKKSNIFPWYKVSEIFKIHYNPKNENHQTWVFDSSNEASGCTGYNTKNLNSLNYNIAEKIGTLQIV